MRVLFIKIKLFPQKKKKFNSKKQDKKDRKRQSSADVTIKEKSAVDKDKSEIFSTISSVTETVKVLLKAFANHLHVRLAKIHLTVATPDAAKTAILYGAVSAAAACLIDLLDQITNLSSLKRSSIIIEPDFVAQKSEMRINITFSISVFGALSTLVKTLIRYVKLKYIKPKGN